MKTKRHYVTPTILREVHLQMEGALLEGSTVDKTAPIISDGQEVVDIDASGSDFDWNNNWTWQQ